MESYGCAAASVTCRQSTPFQVAIWTDHARSLVSPAFPVFGGLRAENQAAIGFSDDDGEGGDENEMAIGGSEDELSGELAAIALDAQRKRSDAKRHSKAEYAQRVEMARITAHPSALPGILAALNRQRKSSFASTVARIEAERIARRKAALHRHHARRRPTRVRSGGMKKRVLAV